MSDKLTLLAKYSQQRHLVLKRLIRINELLYAKRKQMLELELKFERRRLKSKSLLQYNSVKKLDIKKKNIYGMTCKNHRYFCYCV